MENSQIQEKGYFCQGCEFFTAMVMDDDNVGLVKASINKLDKPRLFVLTHCINAKNSNDSEGNTSEKYCPL